MKTGRRIADLTPFIVIAGLAAYANSNAGLQLRARITPRLMSWTTGGEWLAPYMATPTEHVATILAELRLEENDVLVDVGSGDGRFVIEAAKNGAIGIGIEINESLVNAARDNAAASSVENRTTFIHADATTVPESFRNAAAVTMWLTQHGLKVMTPQLREILEPGTLVASHTWPLPDWRPERVHVSTDQDEPWQFFVYRTPLETKTDEADAEPATAKPRHTKGPHDGHH